ncbi:MAG: SusC/RagA family TonB-linked outer membrane protein [Chitinophagaceae bacterium]|nr:SusC/RagA family TonB-linked outer membrane protein [Chitinophagaceae bacterium]
MRMHKLKFLLTCFISVFSLTVSFSQTRTITGKVTSASDKTELSGATVNQKGSTNSVITSDDGSFSISVPSGNVVLIITSVGFSSKEVTVPTGTDNIAVELLEEGSQLSEVVVTALGIQRKAKSLTYSTQTIKGDDLTKVKDANPMNGLIGKVSGLQINRSSSGIGGSVNITLRGLKSLTNNQPLYIVDGLPIVNTGGSGSEGPFGGGTDRGDILSTLNADDILSINVLKGASASALYGSIGSNGAIMITTKKGAAGATKIDVSSSTMFDQAFYLPKLQYSFKQSPSAKGDSEESWGPKGDSEDHVKGFFNTGNTFINSVSLSGGTAKSQSYFSYANTSNKGVLPSNKFNQHTITFRNSTKFFNDKLTFDGSLMYSNQDVRNRPTSGLYFNALSGLYMFPRGLDFDEYKENFEYLSPSRNIYLQNWFEINYDEGLSGTHHEQNPYWALYRNPTFQTRNNIIGSVSLKYELTNWLTLSARGNLNRMWNKFERKVYAGTQGVISGQTSTQVPFDNGRYMREESGNVNMYGDILLVGNKDIGQDIALNFTAGASINDVSYSGWALDARKLRVVNGFDLNNVFRGEANSIATLNEGYNKYQTQSVFGSANIGYKETFYVDLTARNDWSSTLANTASEKSGYFYYSAGASVVLSELLNIPNNYSKLRFTYAEVGNGIGTYVSILPAAYIDNGNITINNTGVFNDEKLKPELTRSYEVGYEGRFINNRLTVDIAAYKSNTINQFVRFTGPYGLLNTSLVMNAGNIQNKGIEIALAYDVIKGGKFNWTTGINYTANRNKVIELDPRLDNKYGIGNFNVLRVGGSFGDLWGKTFLRDDKGMMVVSNDSIPMGSVDGYIGNSNPKAIVGWNNSFTYGNFSLTLSVDGRFGGDVISVTQGYLNSFGYSAASIGINADNNNPRGFVAINAVKQDGTPVTFSPAQKYYQGVGNRDGIIEGLVYDATNIRLRELSLGYKIPVKSNVFKQAYVSIVGRNLFFFKNNAPYDPELNTSTGVTGQGFDSFGLPTTRSYGINLKFSL